MILQERFHYPQEFMNKSQEVLETALRTAPLYQRWRVYDPGPKATLDSRYDALPELTKQMMRENFPLGLVSGHLDVEQALDKRRDRIHLHQRFDLGKGDQPLVPRNGGTGEREASWKLNSNTAKAALSAEGCQAL